MKVPDQPSDQAQWQYKPVSIDELTSNYDLARKYAGGPGNDRALTYAVLALVDELRRGRVAHTSTHDGVMKEDTRA